MSRAQKAETRGISLRTTHLLLLVLAVIVSGLLIYSTYQTSSVFSALSKDTNSYLTRQKAAHDLMEASDYLTEMVQRFTLAGETEYMDKYFEEALVSRRRESAIKTMSQNDVDQAPLEMLQKAMDESVSLMFREYYAMRLVIDAKGYRDYPDSLKTVELKQEDVLLPAEEKMELAQSMVLDEEYFNHKSLIRTSLQESLALLDAQMNAARQETSANMNRDMVAIRTIIIILTVAILFIIWLSARLGTMTLLKAEKAIEQDQPIPVEGAREVRHLARQYNALYAACHPEQHQDEPETKPE